MNAAKMASVHARQRRVTAAVGLKLVAVMRHAYVAIAAPGAADRRPANNPLSRT